MCYEGKCLYCIPIKPACLVLAIINAIANGLILMWYVFVWGCAFLLFVHSGGSSFKIGGVRFKRCAYADSEKWMGLIVIWYFMVLPLVALLNFIFSSLLCNGICNNRPRQVKEYFWYGVVVTVLAAIASVVMRYIDTKSPYPDYSETNGYTELAMLLGCVLHALFLVMVHRTNKKVVEDIMFNGHARLDEDRELSAEKQVYKV